MHQLTFSNKNKWSCSFFICSKIPHLQEARWLHRTLAHTQECTHFVFPGPVLISEQIKFERDLNLVRCHLVLPGTPNKVYYVHCSVETGLLCFAHFFRSHRRQWLAHEPSTWTQHMNWELANTNLILKWKKNGWRKPPAPDCPYEKVGGACHNLGFWHR